MKLLKTTDWLLMSLLFVTLATGFGCVTVGKPPVGDVAIKGYDAVAYFIDNQALQCDESITVKWHDMNWCFVNNRNRILFESGPVKYAPQYDGYCAWAMTEGRKAAADPEIWKIVDGKLYLNCNKAAYDKWSRDIPGNIKKADAIWLKISNKK